MRVLRRHVTGGACEDVGWWRLPTFRVDTKLFRELGELLVGRDSTALVELVKNAYDADATHVSVVGRSLGDPAKGRILVEDDGLGMNSEDFERGFLTIAGRSKSGDNRRSPVFGRRYTGEKGVGRLAAHKLGTRLAVDSRKAGDTPPGAQALAWATSRTTAEINWDRIEQLETLDQIEASRAVRVSEQRSSGSEVQSGTSLAIQPLRRAWDTRAINAFLHEAATLVPLPMLYEELGESVVKGPLLFSRMPVRDLTGADPGFRVSFLGELSPSDSVVPTEAASAHWVAEVSHDRVAGTVEVFVAPTARCLRDFPSAEAFHFVEDIGCGMGPSFTARILQRSQKSWPMAVRGVRVYMEGFRVPPYGDRRDDWLGLEADYRSRGAGHLSRLLKLKHDLPRGDEREALAVQGSGAYLGAVFLHRETSSELEMLVNREGFLPGPGLDFLADWCRVATDLIVRLGYAARQPKQSEKKRSKVRRRQRDASRKSDVNETPTTSLVKGIGRDAIDALRDVEVVLQGDASLPPGATDGIRQVQVSLKEIERVADELGREAVLWRVLASLGTELAAFVHEINALGLEASGAVRDLDKALDAKTKSEQRRWVRKAKLRALDLSERIRRNAAYLVDSTSFEGRKRRSRQRLAQNFEKVLPFFQSRIEQKSIRVINNIPPELRTPPMFPSELSGVFTNLLSNAVKFSEQGGAILVRAQETSERLEVVVENTGQVVDVAASARLFLPYHSTTVKADAVLGQGMGMGLTITRSFLVEYGGDIRFVHPSPGYDAAVRFWLPRR